MSREMRLRQMDLAHEPQSSDLQVSAVKLFRGCMRSRDKAGGHGHRPQSAKPAAPVPDLFRVRDESPKGEDPSIGASASPTAWLPGRTLDLPDLDLIRIAAISRANDARHTISMITGRLEKGPDPSIGSVSRACATLCLVRRGDRPVWRVPSRVRAWPPWTMSDWHPLLP